MATTSHKNCQEKRGFLGVAVFLILFLSSNAFIASFAFCDLGTPIWWVGDEFGLARCWAVDSVIFAWCLGLRYPWLGGPCSQRGSEEPFARRKGGYRREEKSSQSQAIDGRRSNINRVEFKSRLRAAFFFFLPKGPDSMKHESAGRFPETFFLAWPCGDGIGRG